MIVSPDEMNRHIQTVIAAPMSTKGKKYPTQVECEFGVKQGQIVLEQIRTVDKTRLVKKLGELPEETQEEVLSVLVEMFAK